MRIVVVGGVATGMSAAARARRLDETAEIIVLERGAHVSFANCGLPYYVGGEITDPAKLLVQTPESLKAALNLDVRTHHDVFDLDTEAKVVKAQTPAGPVEISYDALVLAPGAAAIKPPLPGIDSPRVTTLRSVDDALALKEDAVSEAKSAVVLGAGFIGLEAAEGLRNQGLEVTVVELAPHVLPPLNAELASLIRQELEDLGITVADGVGATSIEQGTDQDRVVLANGQEIPADIIVLSVGVKPDTEVFKAAGIECLGGAIMVDEHGRTSVPSVWAGGDATVSINGVTGEARPIPLAGPANRAGRLIADSILRGESARVIAQPLGTAIVRVGKLTAALTGANRETLKRLGIEHHTVILHPNHHAAYFPGAKQMHLVVHFAKEDGLLLGAQAVGEAGIDKRIDVLATAIRAGLIISDLIDLDLTYSPPYGNAKDGVNMAGMIGENVLNGSSHLWQPEDLAEVMETALILDVRSETEYAGGHLPGALNVPHTQIRDRQEEIKAQAAGRPIRVHCASGMRSYLAEQYLSSLGLDVANLAGGILTLKAAMAGGLTAKVPLVEGSSRS